MQFLVIDDGVQPRMWACRSMEQLEAIARPANEKGHAMYCFPSEAEARGHFPNLVIEQVSQSASGFGKLFQGLRGMFSRKQTPPPAPAKASSGISEGHVKVIRGARDLMQSLGCQEAAQLVMHAISETPGQPEDWEYGPHLLSAGSEALLHGQGDQRQAQAMMERAIRICQDRRDLEGLLVYLKTGLELHRYYGDGQAAVSLCQNLAHLLLQIDPDEGRYYESQSKRIGAGEPLLRMQVMIGQSRYEIEELPERLEGTLRFIPHRNRMTLHPCRAMVAQGKQLGQQGQFAEALEFFQAASELDPHDPECHYQAGFTLLHLKRYQEAASANLRADRLAPGWFSCRLDGWLAQQLHAGSLDHATWESLNHIEDGGASPTVRLSELEGLRGRAERLGLYHLHLGKAQSELGRTVEAAASFRQGLEAELEDEVRTRLLVSLALNAEDPAERRDLYQRAASLNGHLVSAASAFIALKNEA